jgi:hypothetical protein
MVLRACVAKHFDVATVCSAHLLAAVKIWTISGLNYKSFTIIIYNHDDTMILLPVLKIYKLQT